MSRLSFESAEALIYDPVPMNRNATRTTLYTLGFRHIEAVGTLDAFWNQVRKRPPDLAVVEAQPDKDVCEAIQALRTGATGYNPFIVVIVTAWGNTDGLVGRVINSGADDLLLRPFSTATLGARINTHTERRKGFVVTTDYVGPDRRKDPKRESEIELLQPPNSLRMKAKDRMSPEQVAQKLETELKLATDILHSEKLRRDAFQICILWRLIQARLPIVLPTNPDVVKLKNLTRSVEQRCVDIEVEHAGEWCQSILAAIDGIECGVDTEASMHLLGHAALSLNQLFSPEKQTSEHLTHIDATVAIIHARTQTALAS